MSSTVDHDAQPNPAGRPAAGEPATTAGPEGRGLRIAYLGAGAAGMYCGACIHDNTLAAAMLRMGTDLVFVPTYTPIRTDEEDVSQQRVLFGGINVYLQELVPLFRYTPWFVDRWLDSPRLLDWLSRWQFSVQAEKLGRLTVSTLRAEHGHQRKEIEKLVQWLASDVRPDIVHLSNAILAGFAHEIRTRLGVPVVSSLAGEDIFLEKLRPPYHDQARAELRKRVQDVSAFVALNRYYADFMADYAGIDPRRIHVIPHGLKLEGHAPRRRPDGAPPTVGFLARICSDKGLHHLVEAFRLLAADPDLPDVRLRAAGYLGASDRPYFAELQDRLRRYGLEQRFDYAGELTREEKIAFLHTLDVMSVPTEYHESKGLSILEALANAVPVVLPAHGTFPELVADTGGGLLSTPGSSADLAAKIKQLLVDRDLRETLGQHGYRAVHDRYHDQAMAEQTLAIYRLVVAEARANAPTSPS